MPSRGSINKEHGKEDNNINKKDKINTHIRTSNIITYNKYQQRRILIKNITKKTKIKNNL